MSCPFFIKNVLVDTINSFSTMSFAPKVVTAIILPLTAGNQTALLLSTCLLSFFYIPLDFLVSYPSLLVYPSINHLMIDIYLRNLFSFFYYLFSSFAIIFFVSIIFFSKYLSITYFNTQKEKECVMLLLMPL